MEPVPEEGILNLPSFFGCSRSYQLIKMQFALLISALVAAVPALATDFVWFSGASCTGFVIGRSPGVNPGICVFLANGGSAKSINYPGVPNHVNFFASGGAHDICSNASTIITGGGSGCATAPDG